jgi:2-C-methyl-D-erythritol 4-phosphate cytidylyltransferase
MQTSQPDPISPELGTSARLFALVPCAGVGSRAGGDLPKQYQLLAASSVLQTTLDALAAVNSRILVVVSPQDVHAHAQVNAYLQSRSRPGSAAPLQIDVVPCGGSSRAQTVANGLAWLQREAGAATSDWVMVHDAARCLVLPQDLQRLVDACLPDAVGGLLAWPLADTLKAASGERVAQTLARRDKWLAQTPQMFRIGLLAQALHDALESDPAAVTDEASAVELAGHAPLLVRGSPQNFKITLPEDFSMARAVLAMRLIEGREFEEAALAQAPAAVQALVTAQGPEAPRENATSKPSEPQ